MLAALLALVLASPTPGHAEVQTPRLGICPRSTVRLSECSTGQPGHLLVVVAVCQDTHVYFAEVYGRDAAGTPKLQLVEKFLNTSEMYQVKKHAKTKSLELTEFKDVDAQGNWHGKLTYASFHGAQVTCTKPKHK